MSPLVLLLSRLAAQHHLQTDAAWQKRLLTFLSELDLDQGLYPKDLVTALEAFSAQKPTLGWQPFDAEALDTTGTFNLFRRLHQLLPVEVQDEVTRYHIRSTPLKTELILVLEGYLWCVKALNTPEPSFDLSNP